MALKEPSTRKPGHKVARSSADELSTPSFGLEKKEKERRTGGLWLLSQHLENVSERLLSLEIAWSTQKFRILVNIEGNCCFCFGNTDTLSSYSQERPWVETSLWLLVVFSVVSCGVCTLGQCGVFPSPKCRVWVNLCNCFCQKEACLVLWLCVNFSFLSERLFFSKVQTAVLNGLVS